MPDNQRTILDEICSLNLRLMKVEEYIRRQVDLAPMMMSHMATSTDEDAFTFRFRCQHPGFIPRLRELVPGITPSEERLCIMIRLNMTVREVARMLNIDVKSVHTSRARLKRKLLVLTNEMIMDDWIKNI